MTSRNRKDPGVDRRDFLKVMSSAAVTAGLGASGLAHASRVDAQGIPRTSACSPKRLLPPPRLNHDPTSEKYWKQVRKAFVLPKDYVHMNTGTTGSQPAFSLNNLGVYTFEQLASFDEAQLEWLDGNLSTVKGRSIRDDWSGQAKALLA